MRNSIFSTMGIVTLLLATCVASLVQANHCPFCSAINLTFAEQMRKNDVVVIAKVIDIPPPIDDIDAELPKAKFEIVQILKGNEFVTAGMKFKTLLVGEYTLGESFLVMGADPPVVAWTTPMRASERVIDYIEKLNRLPAGGPERLAFFQEYFEDSESILAFDAYDEFASAPYEDLLALKSKMPRQQLVDWILDPDISVNRRRLYFTMLGVCGTQEDIKILEDLIASGDRKKQAGLDALIACYLNLKKVDGVDLIEKEFITNQECDYVDTLAAVSALRFHGTEVDFIPRDRIVSAIRHLLDRPKMADMIIPDLARWEDWTVVEKLVQMFKDADEETNWLRVPVVNYLRACPNPKAKKYIEELRKIDPDAVRRAEFFADFNDDFGDDEEEIDEFDTDPETSDDKVKSGDDDELSTSPTVPVSAAFSTSTQQQVRVRKVPMISDDLNEEDQDLLSIRPFEGQSPETLAEQLPSEETQVVPIASEIDASTNTEPVSTVSNTTVTADIPADLPQVAQQQPQVTPVAQSSSVNNPTWAIIFVPMLCSAGIFVLLWSVIHGWFQRLIF